MLLDRPALIDQDTLDYVLMGPITSEGQSFSAQVTSHTVEDGSNISDHSQTKPETLSIKSIMADQNDLAAAAFAAVVGAAGIETGVKPVSERIDLLRSWQSTGALLTYNGPIFSGIIEEGYDINIEDMAITKIDISRSPAVGAGVEISLSLQKIRIAQALLVEINLEQAAKSRKKKGKASKDKDKTTDKPKSILKGIFG
jgi:hypothetical protein